MIELLLFTEYWRLHLDFVRPVLFLLTLDLSVSHLQAHAAILRVGGALSIVWAGLAFQFNVLRFQSRYHAADGMVYDGATNSYSS